MFLKLVRSVPVLGQVPWGTLFDGDVLAGGFLLLRAPPLRQGVREAGPGRERPGTAMQYNSSLGQSP